MLNDRDYLNLTSDEEKCVEKAKKYFNKKKKNGFSPTEVFRYHEILPDAYYHYNSLFPNNYLNTKTLNDTENLDMLGTDFKKLLDKNVGERDLLSFIKIRALIIILLHLFSIPDIDSGTIKHFYLKSLS